MSTDEKEAKKPDKVLESVKEIQQSKTIRTRLKNTNTKPNA